MEGVSRQERFPLSFHRDPAPLVPRNYHFFRWSHGSVDKIAIGFYENSVVRCFRFEDDELNTWNQNWKSVEEPFSLLRRYVRRRLLPWPGCLRHGDLLYRRPVPADVCLPGWLICPDYYYNVTWSPR